jgi:hypothetical protein
VPVLQRCSKCAIIYLLAKNSSVYGKLLEFIPNPTFDIVAVHGVHEKWCRATNTESVNLREHGQTDPSAIVLERAVHQYLYSARAGQHLRFENSQEDIT